MVEIRRALVTGATGFLGSHLVRRLADGGWEVHALVRRTSDTGPLEDTVPGIHTHCITADASSVVDAIRRAAPDVCWHLATYFAAKHDVSDIDILTEANIAFGARVLEGLARSGTPNIVYTGTAWQHYRGQPYAPTSLYAATKHAFQDVARYYTDTTQLSMVALKLFDTYGPDDSRGKLVSALLDAATTGDPLRMSPGEQLIDLTHVDDVVSALILAADYPAPDGTPIAEHTVRSDQPVTLRELADLIRTITGQQLDIEWGVRPYRDHEMMSDWQIDTPLPGWSPQIDLEDGLTRLWRHRAHRGGTT